MLLCTLAAPCSAWMQGEAPIPDTPSNVSPAAATTQAGAPPAGVQWKSLFRQSARFLVLENAFRYITEPGTRNPGRPYFSGYLDAVGGLHGWSDGDPFYVNYVGHPMQGAVAGYIWTLNDTKYRYVHFGRDREYWKSRIRAAAFAWAYGEWTEIGPFISEAAIGNIQAFPPQHGFADHVVTPAIGLGWMIAEDAMDQFLVRYVESKTQNRFLRAAVRGAANPARSLANVVSGQKPWARPRDHDVGLSKIDRGPAPERKPEVAPFEFAANAYGFVGSSGSCAGGGATAAFRIGPEWQIVLDVNGCKMNALQGYLSGDSLSYLGGLRWTPHNSARLVPYFQILGGGNKLTQELAFPQQEVVLSDSAKHSRSTVQQTQTFEHNGFALAGGGVLDIRLNRALNIRMIGLEYMRSWTEGLPGFASPQGFQVKSGIVLRMGTW